MQKASTSKNFLLLPVAVFFLWEMWGMFSFELLVLHSSCSSSCRSLLELEGVTIGFGGASVARGVSFEVRQGERVALVGESGSGKTVTALSILRLLQHARIEGQIRFGGEDRRRRA